MDRKRTDENSNYQKIQLVWNFIGEVNLPNDDQTAERERKSKTAQPFDYAASLKLNLLPYGCLPFDEVF